MYIISGITDDARDPNPLVRMMKKAGIKVIYDESEDELVFPLINDTDIGEKQFCDYEPKTLRIESPDYELDIHQFYEEVVCMNLDHREMGGCLHIVLEQLNMILDLYDLQLIKVDTMSDYMSAFVTKKSANTAKAIINAALTLNDSKLRYKDIIETHSKPDIENGERTSEGALNYILENTKINDQTVNFELMIEFLEDYSPEHKFELVERGDKRFISIKKYT